MSMNEHDNIFFHRKS